MWNCPDNILQLPCTFNVVDGHGEVELGRLPTPKPKTEVFSTTETEVGIAATEKTDNRKTITEISV